MADEHPAERDRTRLRTQRSAIELGMRCHSPPSNLDDYLRRYNSAPREERIAHALEFGDVTPGMTEIQCRKALDACGFETIGASPSFVEGHVLLSGNEQRSGYAITTIVRGVVAGCYARFEWTVFGMTGPGSVKFGVDERRTGVENAALLELRTWTTTTVPSPWRSGNWPGLMFSESERVCVAAEGGGMSERHERALDERKSLLSERWKSLFAMERRRDHADVLRMLAEKGVTEAVVALDAMARRGGFAHGR